MARMMVPRFKQSRRLGLNVCGHPKAMKRAAVKGTARSDKKLTEYGKQLLEKQRLRAYYGVLEKQFVNLFKEAKKTAGQTGPNLVIFLERRLDNLAYRMGFASSIRQARQMVTHGHLTVNGKRLIFLHTDVMQEMLLNFLQEVKSCYVQRKLLKQTS